MIRHHKLSLEESELIEGRTTTSPLTSGPILKKLQSLGPLNISDLEEFLAKSKIDFQNLYKDKSISNHKISDFTLVRKLGSGSFGHVVLAQLKNGDDLYAIKVIDKISVIKGNYFQYVHNEKRILQSLNFPFVVYLKFFFVDFQCLYFAMPFVQGGDFYVYLKEKKPLTESHARFYICQLVLALEYLHYLELIHRDLKPENIMLDASGYIKLADFGQCVRCLKNEKAWTHTGTPEYMAPEIYRGEGYGFSVDWWALGVTLFEMCAGSRPFKETDSAALATIVVQARFQVPSTFSKPLRTLVKQLLAVLPTKRIGGSGERGAKEVKRQDWFKKTNWFAVLNRLMDVPYVPG